MTLRKPLLLGLGTTVAAAALVLAGCAGSSPTPGDSSSGGALTPVKLQLQWVAQAQFAGYYVAKDKGFYKDAGLDVTIKAGGPDIAPEQVIAGGGADVIVDWMPAALASREKGVGLVNIAQRLKLKFGARTQITISSMRDVGTSVTIRIPCVYEDSAASFPRATAQ